MDKSTGKRDLEQEADPSKAGNHDTVQYFRRKVLRELKKIKLACPGLKYAATPVSYLFPQAVLP